MIVFEFTICFRGPHLANNLTIDFGIGSGRSVKFVAFLSCFNVCQSPQDTQDYKSFENVLHFNEEILSSSAIEDVLAMLHIANYFLVSFYSANCCLLTPIELLIHINETASFVYSFEFSSMVIEHYQLTMESELSKIVYNDCNFD